MGGDPLTCTVIVRIVINVSFVIPVQMPLSMKIGIMKRKRKKMMKKPIHPGKIIKEEFLKPLGMSVNALATALRMPVPKINDVVRQKRAISGDTALRLAKYFHTTTKYWLNLQKYYDLKITQQSIKAIENEIKLCRIYENRKEHSI